jgi:hypothetical protein
VSFVVGFFLGALALGATGYVVVRVLWGVLKQILQIR